MPKLEIKPCPNEKCAEARKLGEQVPPHPNWRLALCASCRADEVTRIMNPPVDPNAHHVLVS